MFLADRELQPAKCSELKNGPEPRTSSIYWIYMHMLMRAGPGRESGFCMTDEKRRNGPGE